MDQSASTPTVAVSPRARKLRELGKTLVIAAMVIPLPAALIYAAFSMPGMP